MTRLLNKKFQSYQRLGEWLNQYLELRFLLSVGTIAGEVGVAGSSITGIRGGASAQRDVGLSLWG